MSTPPPDRTPVLVYEVDDGGHRAEHLLWLARRWPRHAQGRTLTIAAPEAVCEQRAELGERLREQPDLSFVPLPPRDDSKRSLRNAVAVDRLGPLRALQAQTGARHVLMMRFEHFVAALAARRRLATGTRIAGLSLRPIVPPVPDASGHVPLSRRAVSGVRDAMVRAALRHPQVRTLLTLDPSAVPVLRARTGADVRFVPDPVPPEPIRTPAADVRARFGIDAGRTLAVLPGALEARKGALRLPEALLHLDPDVARQTAVLMAGAIESGLEGPLREAVARAVDAGVQVVLHPEYLATDDLPSVVAAADLVVLPYVNHVGSSGFQMRAAAAGVPALVAADGLMGQLATDHGLGPVADTHSPEALGQALSAALRDPRAAWNPVAAQAFLDGRSVEAFADAILTPLLDPLP